VLEPETGFQPVYKLPDLADDKQIFSVLLISYSLISNISAVNSKIKL
jgi:hypothetical protein